MVPSLPPAATSWPEGENSTDMIGLRPLSSVANETPVMLSHSLTSPSSWPEANEPLSGANAAHVNR
jgi:hypothetical protein